MRSVSRAVSVLALAVALAAIPSARADHDEYTCPDHPANDDYAYAEELPLLPWITTGTTDCATHEPDEPETWCVDTSDQSPWSRASVWYRYRPRDTGRVTVHVFGATRRSYPPGITGLLFSGPVRAAVHVYQGESFDALKYACDVGENLPFISQASFLAVEGKTYFIQVTPVEPEGVREEGIDRFVLVLAPKIEQAPTLP